MPRKPKIFSKTFLEKGVIQRIDRKHWNKAIEIIEGKKEKKHRVCAKSRKIASWSSRRVVNTPVLLSAIRQAVLRHDWDGVSRLLGCLIKSPGNNSQYTNVFQKIFMVLLLSSPLSSPTVFDEYCRMAVGLDESEIATFLEVITHLPKELPRSTLVIGKKWFEETENGPQLAELYLKAVQELDSKRESLKLECGDE